MAHGALTQKAWKKNLLKILRPKKCRPTIYDLYMACPIKTPVILRKTNEKLGGGFKYFFVYPYLGR